MEYEYHEMFKDRSVKIDRNPKRPEEIDPKKNGGYRDHRQDTTSKYKDITNKYKE